MRANFAEPLLNRAYKEADTVPSMATRLSFELKSRSMHRRVRRIDAELWANETRPVAEILARQARAAAEMALHAYDSTRFYRRIFSESGLTRLDVAQPANFCELPTITKLDLRAHRDELLAEGLAPARLLASSTGGSTGEPLTLFHDRRAPHASMWRRVYRWWGISPADHQAVIARKHLGLRERADDLLWWPTRRLRLDARSMTPEAVASFLAAWNRLRPPLLNGYVGGVHELALEILASGMRVESPQAVAVTAAPVTTAQRATITEAFGAPVYDQYRSAEVPWIAAECTAQSGLHVQADLRVVEVLGSDGRPCAAGVPGEVVLTDLTNRVFPLVRYRIGDRSALVDGRCPCGNSLPRISAVEGRTSDVLRTPAGRAVTGGLTVLFNDCPHAVRQFQVHQLADHSVVLRYVPGDRSAVAEVERARRTLARLLGDEVEVRAERVARIDHDGGKARVVRSDLPQREVDPGSATAFAAPDMPGGQALLQQDGAPLPVSSGSPCRSGRSPADA